MTSFKISDGSKLTGNPIQTIITDLPPQDDKLADEIYLYTPEQSPTQEGIMTQSNDQLPENRLDLIQYPMVESMIDERLQHDGQLGNDFTGLLTEPVEDYDEEIEATRSPADSEVREQTESSQTICRHVSQIAQEKEDEWQSFITFPDQQQFAPQNVRISYSTDLLPSVQLS